MKTKVLFLTLIIASAIFKLTAQDNQNKIVKRILQFDQMVQKLQNRQVNQATVRLDSSIMKTFDAPNNSYKLNSIQKYAYDANNYNINDTYNSWDIANGTLITQGKSDYTYTSNGFIETETYFYFDNNSNSLVPSQKRTYTYNSDNQLTMMVYQNYDISSSSFVNQNKETYSYQSNTAPKPNSILTEQWDTANNAWVPNQLGDVIYNSNFQFTDIVMKQRDVANNVWNNSMHFTRSYDSNMRLIEDVTQIWDIPSSQWKNNSKRTFTYTLSGQNTTILKKFFSWDTNNNSWFTQSKTITLVDNNDNLLAEEYYYWNNSNMVGTTKMVYTYNGALVIIEYFPWDNANNQWATDALNKVEHTYDSNVDKTDLILPHSYSNSSISSSVFSMGLPYYDNFHHKLLKTKNFNRASATDPWIESMKTEYKYTDTTLSVNDTKQIKAKLYPVPVENFLKVQVKNQQYQIKIIDLDGRLVYAGTHQNNEKINLSNLTKGVYVYHITTKNGQISGQIIKK